jgi:hypothetical protein
MSIIFRSMVSSRTIPIPSRPTSTDRPRRWFSQSGRPSSRIGIASSGRSHFNRGDCRRRGFSTGTRWRGFAAASSRLISHQVSQLVSAFSTVRPTSGVSILVEIMERRFFLRQFDRSPDAEGEQVGRLLGRLQDYRQKVLPAEKVALEMFWRRLILVGEADDPAAQ